ncbi:MAG: hypothetical protein ACXWPM_10510, partial [Bdellovibrionota bacterium]
MHPVLKGLRSKITPRVVIGLLALYFGLGYVAYGLAWREFSRSPDWILGRGGRNVNAPITHMRTSGFGLGKNFWLRFKDYPEEYMVAGILANPDGIEDDYKPVPLSNYLHVGAKVALITS